MPDAGTGAVLAGCNAGIGDRRAAKTVPRGGEKWRFEWELRAL